MTEYRTEVRVKFVRYIEANTKVQAIDKALDTVLRATDNTPKDMDLEIISSTVDKV